MITESPACIYRVLDGKINEFVLTEASRRAMDEMFEIIEKIQIDAAANNPADHRNPSLVDSSAGLQPLNYAFKRMQPIMAQYPEMRRAGRNTCVSQPIVEYHFNDYAPDSHPLLSASPA